MIKAEDIYKVTNNGLDIILHYYPQARDCVGTNRHFKRRPSEDDASACIKLFGKEGSQQVYKVTDFGDTGTAQSPVDICMYEEGLRFNEAILKLASMYNVTDELNRNVNKPDIRKVPASQDQKDGTKIFELADHLTPDQLRILGPRVTQENTEALHWYSAKYIGYVKNREVTYKYATATYPIFMRECLVKPAEGDTPEVKFYKIYEPLNPDKQWRFSYTPEGVKPKDYINGLSELKALYREFNSREEAAFKKNPANAEKPYKEQKLQEAFICSGERDALCVKSLGFSPIWFNSETYKLSEQDYKEIMKYVEVLYNIPDIDTTGRVKGTELALRFIDIHTIWLPAWLTTYRDQRGKPRKDFRDFMELRSKNEDFRNLMTLAMPAKFWYSKFNEKSRQWDHNIDADCLHYFLRLNGFYSLHDENSSSTKYIRITGNIVKLIKAKDIRKFIRGWAQDSFLSRDIRNLILNSPKLSDTALDNLQEIELDFTNYTHNTQMFFFPGCSMEVSGTGIKEHPANGSTLSHYVWEENVLKHKVRLMEDMFTISRKKDIEGNDVFDIRINAVPSNFFGYVINSSRVYWRKELEYNFDDKSVGEAESYREKHKFDIEGEGLTEEEVVEQKKNLINKIFTIGYMLHRYKSPSRAWAPQAMDNKIGEDGECNGRSGKSFMFKALSYFMKSVKLSGRNPKLMDNPHVFDQVNQHTDFILVDDCDRYLNTGLFYDIITSDMTVNPKNNQSFTIPFEESAKLGFTTNYVPIDFDPSTEARLLYLVFSDYYHQRTEDNDYRETRSIRDDFGKDLFSKTYSENEWNADINFFLQCCRFYLSLCEESIKLLPPMENIIRRKYKADMGNNFEDWANSYFSPDSEHLDCFIVREKAFADYKSFSGVNKITMQRFTKALKGFVALCPYIDELNPKDLRNSQGRIVRKDNDGKAADMIYLRSCGTAETAAGGGTEPADPTLMFVPDERPDE